MAISLVQSKAGTGTSLTLSSATGAGNCLVVCVVDLGPGISTPAITAVTLGGSAGNFAKLTEAASSADGLASIWADPNCAGGQTAVAVTESNGSTPVIYAFEFSGVIATSPLDKQANGVGSGTSWSSGTTAATTQAVEAWIGAAQTKINAPTGPASPWTNTSQANGNTKGIAGYQVTSAAGTAVYSGTVGATEPWAAAVITLLPAATGPAVAPFYPAIRPLARLRLAVRAVSARGTSGAPVTPPVITHAPPAAGPVVPPRPPRRRQAAAYGSPGAPVIPPPPVAAVFYPATRPLARLRLAVRAISARGTSGVPVTPPVITHAPAAAGPLTPPRPPRRRIQPAGHGGRGAPVIPVTRNLLISLASSSGTDDYGNPFPQGILATAGTIQGPTFIGSDFIINQAGAFFYTGTPAAGNLAASIIPGTSTVLDPFGNSAQPGQTVYGTGGGYAQLLAGILNFTGGTGQNTPASMQTQSHQGELFLTSGLITALDFAATISLLSEGANSGISAVSLNGDEILLNSPTYIPSGDGPYIQNEGWHDVSGGAGIGVARVKMLPWNMVHLDIEVSASSSGTFTMGSLPSASYYPTQARHLPLGATAGTNGRIFIPTSGAIQVLVGTTTGAWSGGYSAPYPTN